MDELNKIFIQIFKDEALNISSETNSSDIPNWDSLNNMHLIVAIEDHYDIRFELEEIQSLKNVGELYSCIKKYLDKKEKN